jgi:RNA polymerase sigma-70 factor (ECF subfamily)
MRAGPVDSRPVDVDRADAASFVALYPALRRFAAVVAPSWIEPDDLVQEALVRVLRGGPIGRFEDPLTYLRRVIVNLVTDEHRATIRLTRIAPLVAGDTYARTVSYPSDLSFLDALTPIDRALLELVEVEGWKASDAGALVGCSAVAARARLVRARRRLRQTLTEEDA